MELDQKLKDKINFVAGYIGTKTNDWLIVKRHLINSFGKEERKLFSKRHFSTKKQLLNNFDLLIINYWKTATGIQLVVEPTKLHDPNWIYKEKGWGLKNLNEQRKKSKVGK